MKRCHPGEGEADAQKPKLPLPGFGQVFKGTGEQVCGSTAWASFNCRTLDLGHLQLWV